MDEKLYNMMNWPLIEGIEYTDIDNPNEVLGQHLVDEGVIIQAFVPGADLLKVAFENQVLEMTRMDEKDFFAILIDRKKKIDYKLIAKFGEVEKEYVDPYSFEPSIPIKYLKKFNAGILYQAYDFLGAHCCEINGVKGVRFAVWAPFAVRVSVVGDFNNWDGRIHQMSRREDTGVFELFIPGIKASDLYKYEIKKKGDENILKADPYSMQMEKFPGDASIVANIDGFEWDDDEFLKQRSKQNVESMPLSIFELNIATFAKKQDSQSYLRAVAKPLADYVKRMGYTHVELMPIMEYLNKDLYGYATTYFFSISSLYGTALDLMYFVNYMHKENIGVILEWTPNQFDSNESGLAAFDGSCLYEHMNPLKGFNKKQGTHLFNYARPEVTNYLIANVFMWIEQFHIDGIKIANVASMLYLDYDKMPGEWIPNIYGGNENLDAIEFIKHFNSIVHKKHAGVMTIAQDNSGYPMLTGEVNEECLGFDLKINEEWRKEIINYMGESSMMRHRDYNEISLSMIYQYSDAFIVGFGSDMFIKGQSALIGKMAGDTEERKFANIRLALGYTFMHPGKKMLFMGQDFAQYNEWLPQGTLDFDILKTDKHKQVNDFVMELNKIYTKEKALFELDNDSDGFEWINNISARECVLTFSRKGKNFNLKNTKDDDMILVICNFDTVDRQDYKVGVLKKGKYKEILNSDSKKFGGNDFVNSRMKQSKTDECDGREESIRVNIAALSIAIFKYSRVDEKLLTNKEAKENVVKKSVNTAKRQTKSKMTKEKNTVGEKNNKTTEKKKAVVKNNTAGDKKTAVENDLEIVENTAVKNNTLTTKRTQSKTKEISKKDETTIKNISEK